MHRNVLVSLAFALGAVAGPCIPPGTTASVTSGSSTSLETSETSTLSATSSVPVTSSTFSDLTTSSTTVDSATESTTTSASSTASVTSSATSDATTLTTISITSSATSDVTTSSTAAPSSTSSPSLGNFNAIGQNGGTSGTPARLPPPQYGSITLGGYNPSGVAPGVFSIEAITGALVVDGSKICGFYSPSYESASVYACNASPRTNEAPITCDQGQMDGGILKCSAPKMTCIEDFDDENDPVCYATGGVWTQFIGYQFLGNYFLLSIGSEAAASVTGFIPVDLLIQAV